MIKIRLMVILEGIVVFTLATGLTLSTPVWSDNPRELASEIRNLAQNPRTVQNQDVQEWLIRAEPFLPKFNHIDLTMSLHSLSKLKKVKRLRIFVPASFPASFIDAWSRSALSKIDTFTSQGLSNSLYAFSVLGIHPTEQLLHAWQSKAISSLSSFNSQELSNSLYAFSVLGIHPTEQLLQAWQSKAISSLSSFTSQGLSNSLYAFSVLGIHPTEQFLHAWQSKAISSLSSFNSQELSNSLYAFSVLGIHPTEQFLQAWQSKAISSLSSFTSQELSNSLYAFSVLGIHPTEQLLHAWQSKAISSLSSFNSQGLSNSLYAFSVLGIHPTEQFLQAWQSKTISSLSSFTSQNLSNSLYAFSVLGIHPTEQFLQAWQREAVKTIGDFKKEELHQLFLARKLLFAQFKIVLPLQITLRLSKAASSFKDQVPTSSYTQGQVFKDLKIIYPEDLQEEYWSDATASYVDFAVPSAKLIIQFDGPHHFLWIKNQEVLSPQDQAMDFILRQDGWTVIRMSYQDWNRIKGRPQDERVSELKKILDRPAPNGAKN